MIRRAFLPVLLGTAAMAHASDKPVYAPAPAWAKPAPQVDAAKLDDDGPILLVMDSQQRLQDGQVWSYFESDTRVASNDVLNKLGTITLPWQPDKGDLIIHTMEILRGAEHINLLANGAQPFTVLRREQQLEQLQLNGVLTATMPVEGLRVGDVLRIVFSITQKDPTLKGKLQAFAPLLAAPVPVQFARVRLLWPHGDDVHWKVEASGADPKVVTAGGYDDLTLTLPLPKQPDMPDDAPQRYRHPTILEASSFDSWAQISQAMAPLYATDGLIVPGSPLAAEVDKLTRAEPDPVKRAAAALQLVQDKVRYLFKGMDTGNYVPQTPAQTWSLRYGDCKAKTLLLLALLHAMKIEAEPVLANIELGDLVKDRLPSPGAFDHVLVHATIGGQAYFLDGTDTGSRLEDIADTPPFHTVLPLRSAGANLLPIVMKPYARPQADIQLALDTSAGVNEPVPFTLAIAVRGQIAQLLHTVQLQGGNEAVRKLAASMSKDYVDNPLIVAPAISFDAANSTAVMKMTGVSYPDWSREDERYRITLDHAVSGLSFDPDRSRAAWQDIPVYTGDPETDAMHITVKLPDGGKGFTLDGDTNLSQILAGSAVERHTVLNGATLTIDERVAKTGAEIAVPAIGAEREKLARAQQNLLKLLAPADYPSDWRVAEQGRKTHAFDAIYAAYKQAIADQPDKAAPFSNRAWFEAHIYDGQGAIDDLGRMLAIEPSAGTYLWRAQLYSALGQDDKALADALAARKLDPSSDAALSQLADLYNKSGKHDEALALLDTRIAVGGKDKNNFVTSKAQMIGEAGDKDKALSLLDSAVTASPGNPELLNNRCWLKGTLDVALDTALKDCTKAIELSDSPAAVLDSRAMVYFRMNRFDDALADLNAALEGNPSLPASLFMRGVIRRKQGKTADGDTDLAAARFMSPMIDKRYARYGIKP